MLCHGQIQRSAGMNEADADEVATKMSAPAALAAPSTLAVPSTLTCRICPYSRSLRAEGSIMAAVWKTVRGFFATDAGHGVEKDALTDDWDVMSALTKLTPLAFSFTSCRLTGWKSTIRMLSGDWSRWRSCKTISPPTMPKTTVVNESRKLEKGVGGVVMWLTSPTKDNISPVKTRGEMSAKVRWVLLHAFICLLNLVNRPATGSGLRGLQGNGLHGLVDTVKPYQDGHGEADYGRCNVARRHLARVLAMLKRGGKSSRGCKDQLCCMC